MNQPAMMQARSDLQGGWDDRAGDNSAGRERAAKLACPFPSPPSSRLLVGEKTNGRISKQLSAFSLSGETLDLFG